MKIDGTAIANTILPRLERSVNTLLEKHIHPHLAIVLVGNDLSSSIYVGIKQKIGKKIGAKVSVFKLLPSITSSELIHLINLLNYEQSVHGIIIQRPVPIVISNQQLNKLVIHTKDVDGFHPQSLYTSPIALAVLDIIKWAYHNKRNTGEFISWLKKQNILIIGRGETGGYPIIKYFKKLKIEVRIGHTQSKNIYKLSKKSSIIISCVGKPNIVRHNMVNKETMIIGIGLHEENNKLLLDYDQNIISKNVSFYTPVPGGVGPVNVAYLFKNLVDAARKA